MINAVELINVITMRIYMMVEYALMRKVHIMQIG